MVGVVLAAGYGKRLAGFAELKHKCLVPLNGVCLIDYNLGLLKEFGMEQILIVVGYNHNYIEQHVGNNYLGVPVSYILQDPPQGIADGVRCALPVIGGAPFFMCLADEILFSPTLNKMKNAFQRPGVAGVCGIVKSDVRQITKAYTIDLNEQGEVLHFWEKPRPEELFNHYRGTGYCLIGPALAEMVEKTPKNIVRGEYEMCDWFSVGIAAGLKMIAVEAAAEGININTQEDYLRAEALMKGENHDIY